MAYAAHVSRGCEPPAHASDATVVALDEEPEGGGARQATGSSRADSGVGHDVAISSAKVPLVAAAIGPHAEAYVLLTPGGPESDAMLASLAPGHGHEHSKAFEALRLSAAVAGSPFRTSINHGGVTRHASAAEPAAAEEASNAAAVAALGPIIADLEHGARDGSARGAELVRRACSAISALAAGSSASDRDSILLLLPACLPALAAAWATLPAFLPFPAGDRDVVDATADLAYSLRVSLCLAVRDCCMPRVGPASSTLAAVIAAASSCRASLASLGIIPLIVGALDATSGDGARVALMEAACAALHRAAAPSLELQLSTPPSSAGGIDESRHALVDAGAAAVLLRVLRLALARSDRCDERTAVAPSSAAIAEACGALLGIAQLRPEGRAALERACGGEAALLALVASFVGGPAAIAFSPVASAALALYAGVAPVSGSAVGAAEVSRVLAAHATSPGVILRAAQACAAGLGHGGCGGDTEPAVREQWFATGIPLLLIDALSTFVAHADVAEAACIAVGRLSVGSIHRDVAAIRVASVLTLHVSSQHTQLAAIQALTMLASHPATASVLHSVDVCAPVLVSALATHLYSPSIVSAACELLKVVIAATLNASKRAELVDGVVNAGAVQRLAAVMARHLASHTAAASACALLRTLADSGARYQTLVLAENGLVALLKTVVVRHPGTPAASDARTIIESARWHRT